MSALALRTALLGLLLLAGCALGYLNPNYLLPNERRERIQEAARQYTNMLRFGYLDRAVVFVEPDLRAEFLALFAEGGRIEVRFSEVSVGKIELGAERDRAIVHVTARFYRLPSVREETLVEAQSWRYDPDGMRWLISPDLELYRRGSRRPQASRRSPLRGTLRAAPTSARSRG